MEVETKPAEPSASPPAGQPRGPESDVRLTAEHHSQMATVLAGFAFTAVILVVQQAQGPGSQSSSALLLQATASFLIALAGCIAAAMTFGVVASDLKLSPRPRGTFFLASVSTLISTLHVFYGVSRLLAVYVPRLVYLSQWLLILTALYSIINLLNIEIGLARFYDPAPYTRRARLLLAAPSAAILGIASMLSLMHAVQADQLAGTGFPVVVGCSVLLVTVSSAWALAVHSQEEHYRLPARVSAGWTLILTLLFAFMILMA